MADFKVVTATQKIFEDDVLVSEHVQQLKIPLKFTFPELPKLPPDIPLPALPKLQLPFKEPKFPKPALRFRRPAPVVRIEVKVESKDE
jgi:hypothetical protein